MYANYTDLIMLIVLTYDDLTSYASWYRSHAKFGVHWTMPKRTSD